MSHVLNEWKILTRGSWASCEGWAGNGLQLGKEMAGGRPRERRWSPLQNGGVHSTHSFPTAWCTSVHPWGSSSGPWGRPGSAWSWGEKRAQGMPGSGHCWGWALRSWGKDWPSITPLPVLSLWKASEMLNVWVCDTTASRGCCRWHCIALQCCLRLWLTKFPHQTLLLLLFSCLASGSQQDGLAESPSPLSGTPRCISRDWHCKSLNRTFLCHKKTPKISLIKIICLCGGKERLQWESQYELLYLPKVLQSPWDLYFCLHFPLGAACIFCVILPCCSVPWSVLEMFGWFNKLILNDLLQIVRLELFGLIMLKMLFPEVFRFFGFLPWCRNSRITQETEIEFFYHQTYKKLIRRERYFNLKSYVVRNSQLEFRGMLGQKMWQSPPSCKCLA